MKERETVTCRLCQKVEELRWLDSVDNQLREQQLCFTCNFWQEKVDLAAMPGMQERIVRVNGTHYLIGEENSETSGWFKGFGGRRFDIRFHDGRLVTTTNLWCQGGIPEHFRSLLPDNAEFLP